MKKILFICPRNPFAERFSGDVIRAKKFIYYFSLNICLRDGIFYRIMGDIQKAA